MIHLFVFLIQTLSIPQTLVDLKEAGAADISLVG